MASNDPNHPSNNPGVRAINRKIRNAAVVWTAGLVVIIAGAVLITHYVNFGAAFGVIVLISGYRLLDFSNKIGSFDDN